jgi:hypothetical protein
LVDLEFDEDCCRMAAQLIGAKMLAGNSRIEGSKGFFGSAHPPLPRQRNQACAEFETSSVHCPSSQVAVSRMPVSGVSSPDIDAGEAGIFLRPGNENRAAVSQDSRSVNGRLSDGGDAKMVRYLCEIGEFVRRLRIQARFGELSRAPLQLLRLELRNGIAECDWVARPPDRWDVELQLKTAERSASLQALKDAIEVRGLLFRVLPDLNSAVLRAYRQSADERPKLIITGTVSREQRAPAYVRSLAMRAKLFGLRFWLNEGILDNLPPEEYAVNS